MPLLNSRSSSAAMLSVFLLTQAEAQEVNHFAENIRSTPWLSPAEEQKSFRLPPGFEIQLVASEPDIQKPMNLGFDARGRLWVTDSREYPYPVPAGRKGKDTVKILEDTDGDGRADKITTFADGLSIPIGLYPYKDGAIVFSIPHIWHLRDLDGDGRADDRKILYGPLGFERDTHGLNNSFRRNFDGWLYACHGFNNHTTLHGKDGSSITMQSGNTYRVRLDGSRVEQFTWGQVNPFGMAVDPLGNLFTADCHSSPIYQLIREGYYPSFGKPHDGLGFVPPMMTHSHGSTAICGTAYYSSTEFPPEYRSGVYIGNVMTCRVHHDRLIHRGATIIAEEQPDLVSTTDPWFRPVDVRMGPDGAIYIADFYNRIIGHYEVRLDHPGRDRTSGRIWRVVYTGTHPDSRPPRPLPDLTKMHAEELVAYLADPNLQRRLLATNELVDRLGAECIPAVRLALEQAKGSPARAHALWILHRLDRLELNTLEEAAMDPSPIVRTHVLRIITEIGDWSEGHEALATEGLRDANAFVQRSAAEALGAHPSPKHLHPLLRLLRNVPADDAILRHATRIALRNQLRSAEAWRAVEAAAPTESNSRELAALALSVESASAAEFLLEHVQTYGGETQRIALFFKHASCFIPQTRLRELESFTRERFADAPVAEFEILAAIGQGLLQRGKPSLEHLREWATELSAKLLAPTTGQVGNVEERLVAGATLVRELRIETSRSRLAELVQDTSASVAVSVGCAQALAALAGQPSLHALAVLAGEPGVSAALRQKVAAALADPEAERVRASLVQAMQEVPKRLQTTMAQRLATSAQGAETLLELVEDGKASARLLQEKTIREQILAAAPREATQRMEELTQNMPPADAETSKRIAELVKKYPAKPGDAAAGATLFEKNCEPCHQIAQKGAVIGPQLDGIGNRGLERIIEDMVDPNRNVDVAFRAETFVLADGNVLAGLYRRDEGQTVVVADNEGKEMAVAKQSILQRVQTENSLMPENFVDTLTEQELHDLLAYLLAERGTAP